MIVKYYGDNNVKTRFSIIKMSMIQRTRGVQPKLKGQTAEIKNLTPALYWVWQQGMDPNDEAHVAINNAFVASIALVVAVVWVIPQRLHAALPNLERC